MTGWHFTIPGQPPSVKHSYRIVYFGKRPGLAKVPAVEAFQLEVKELARKAKPPGWEPSGEHIRVQFWFHLGTDVDCDNAMSAILDGITWGIGVDDRRFLPCAVEKTTGWMHPWVEVVVDG